MKHDQLNRCRNAKKVVSTSVMFRNGASVSVGSLEASIIEISPFETIFAKIFLIFQKCQNARLGLLGNGHL